MTSPANAPGTPGRTHPGRVPARTRRRSPLWRRTDVLRRRLSFALFVSLLAAAGLTASLALLDYQASRTAADRAARQSHPTRAVVLSSVTGGPIGVINGGGEATASVQWADARGEHTARAPVPPGALPGDSVRVWLTGAGVPVCPPESAMGSLGDAASLGSTVLIGSGGALVGLWGLGRLALARRDGRAWEAEWSSVEPLWSRLH